MALAHKRFQVVDTTGAVRPYAYLEIRKEIAGNPLAVPYTDRGGTLLAGNPLQVDGDGKADLFLDGGAYRVRTYGTDFDETERYVPVGTAQEVDIEDILGSLTGGLVIVTTAGTTAVPAGTTAVVLNLSGPGSVNLTLPAVADQSGVPIGISDWGGNATVTLTPDGSEKVMGVAGAFALGTSSGQGLGLALSTTLNPSSDLSGWFTC